MKKQTRRAPAKGTTMSVYERRGVSATKTEVHQAVSKLNPGLYPGAFCRICPDVLGDPPSPRYCNIMHPDTDGTKPALAYLVWKVTGNIRAVCGLAQDALVMNFDDVGCVGACGRMLATQTLGRNKHIIPGEIIEALIASNREFCERLWPWGIECTIAAGETADVGDVIRTLDVASCVTARMRRKDVIDASRIVPGDIMIGFSSTGQAIWESEPNSGIGCNGLTNARHSVLAPHYRKYTETYAPQTPRELVYCGRYDVDSALPHDPSQQVWQALLSPTRTYLPLMRAIIKAIPKRYIHGFIHCTGGGQTKIINFGQPGNVYIIDNPFPIAPVFVLIQRASGLPWEEMYQVSNMGWRLIMLTPDQGVVEEVRAISAKCRIDSQPVGRVAAPESSGVTQRRVIIQSPFGTLVYPKPA